MKLNKYSVASDRGSTIGSFSSSKGSTSSSSSGIVSLNRNIWGQEDDGSDVDGDLVCGGNMFVVTSSYSEDDDEDESKYSASDEVAVLDESLEDIFDEDDGNLYVEKNLKVGRDIEAASSFGKESFLAYPDKNGDKTNILDLFKMIMPLGSIIMHNGSYTKEELLKYGWAICDGTNGTPNLIGKFVKADSYDKIGTTGGQDSVTLTTDNLPAHNHTAATSINLNLSQDSPSLNSAWNNKLIPALDRIEEGVYDKGGDSNFALYTGYKQGDNGLIGIKIDDLLLAAGGVSGSASASTTIGSTGSGTAFNNQPAFYSLIYIMRIK